MIFLFPSLDNMFSFSIANKLINSVWSFGIINEGTVSSVNNSKTTASRHSNSSQCRSEACADLNSSLSAIRNYITCDIQRTCELQKQLSIVARVRLVGPRYHAL